jgi:hypothetical protein
VSASDQVLLGYADVASVVAGRLTDVAASVQPPEPKLWDHPQLVAVLAERDIAGVFRILSSWCGYSQRQIGALTGQSRPAGEGLSRPPACS